MNNHDTDNILKGVNLLLEKWMLPNEAWRLMLDEDIVFIRKLCSKGMGRLIISSIHLQFSTFRGSNCLEMKKETEIKIQTLTSDHKSKVRKCPF